MLPKSLCRQVFLSRTVVMSKRDRSVSSADIVATKRARATQSVVYRPIKVATKKAAEAVDANPPLNQLAEAIKHTFKAPEKGTSVVYWMRLADLRIKDNRALSLASIRAQDNGVPLVALFVISPQDYVAHDRGARRIDFVLRNLATLKKSFSELHIPFQIITFHPRTAIPSRIISLLEHYGSTSLYANIEYEVDELRRDIKLCELAKRAKIEVTLTHNKCIIEPGIILSKHNRGYAVYSPYQRNWISILNNNIALYLAESPPPKANKESIRKEDLFATIFDASVPSSVPGFELEEKDLRKMKEVWPEGEVVAAEILQRFLHTKSRLSQLGDASPLANGSQPCSKHNRVANYGEQRDRVDRDTTSRLSVYLTSGVLSSRECVRATMQLTNSNKVDGDRTSGIGRWIQEIAWRDFYNSVLVSFPRVSMGRPFLEKFSEVVWENHQAPQDSAIGRQGRDEPDGEMLKRWKEGRTGVPIVDASMRCLNTMGWMHNRARMICAMYLTKDLMIDWRVGERYFMEMLMDGDLASNNGGWQWCASTGVDPCPYFRIFNPYTQSQKADPTGEFIRYWVPELRKLRGPDTHNPSAVVALKLGYVVPVIPHNEARVRALRRYKNPGEE